MRRTPIVALGLMAGRESATSGYPTGTLEPIGITCPTVKPGFVPDDGR